MNVVFLCRIFDVPITMTVADGSADWTVGRPNVWLTDSRDGVQPTSPECRYFSDQ
jgi:hypothetical protein